MITSKQRRFLIGLAVISLALWLFTSFSRMVIWYSKGTPMTPPTPREMSPSLCVAYWQSWKDSVFSQAPGDGAGYLLIALFLLFFLQKNKSHDKDDV